MRRTDAVKKVLGHLADAADPETAPAQVQRLNDLGFLEPAGDERTGAELAELADYGRSTLYPVLKRLHEAGLVERRDERTSDPSYQGRKPRVFYKLTSAGREFLHRGK